LKRESTDKIRDAAKRTGMKMLAEDGWRLVARGITTVEEVLSVTTAKEVASSTIQNSEAEDETNLAGVAVTKGSSNGDVSI
jgi:hypothetical protein